MLPAHGLIVHRDVLCLALIAQSSPAVYCQLENGIVKSFMSNIVVSATISYKHVSKEVISKEVILCVFGGNQQRSRQTSVWYA